MPEEAHPSAVEAAAAGTDDVLSLAAQLCFALYSTSRSMTAAYRPYLDAMRVTYPQYLTLLALWETPGITMKQLADRLRLDYGTVSPLVQRLQTRGLVESVRSSRDRRAVQLHATPASLALEQQARQMIGAVLQEVGYPLETVTALRDQVTALGARLDTIVAERDAR
ncbi:DNA-binding transcriptional regulator, MarR family [Nocardia amikacinitolerans]|uniref:MarR family winged helix-turn-helix transcriptional regulator n=1 Tax=Nocardia amikacinitolerans TaxID=756689 RepID=UPI00083565A8|nr:MarR family transcriptional regulator [Nocardia amikacinitolerans]MCP2315280.1 DNA-binding transcriptional regulator, MarR family [Nocardia amikacinitolerans]